jgi:hypothetical protein
MYTAEDARNSVIKYEIITRQKTIDNLMDNDDNKIAYDIIIEEIKTHAMKGETKMLILPKDIEEMSLFNDTEIKTILRFLGYDIKTNMVNNKPESYLISW